MVLPLLLRDAALVTLLPPCGVCGFWQGPRLFITGCRLCRRPLQSLMLHGLHCFMGGCHNIAEKKLTTGQEASRMELGKPSLLNVNWHERLIRAPSVEL